MGSSESKDDGAVCAVCAPFTGGGEREQQQQQVEQGPEVVETTTTPRGILTPKGERSSRADQAVSFELPARKVGEVVVTRQHPYEEIGIELGDPCLILERVHPDGAAWRCGATRYLGWGLVEVNGKSVRTLRRAQQLACGGVVTLVFEQNLEVLSLQLARAQRRIRELEDRVWQSSRSPRSPQTHRPISDTTFLDKLNSVHRVHSARQRDGYPPTLNLSVQLHDRPSPSKPRVPVPPLQLQKCRLAEG
eukprot:Sspe_Gene.78856::Locus_49379_Transcript_1_1_Confidence_1.000_Length_1148::g.78856::m.78856